ncbi:SidA/IucD/PvdA family monooxygenase [Sinorhizobium meliloti]|uniref:flavin-containing monooxygenase n=1 Tax=Rhizobium meliloti TaxID=382 RepID=UPI00299E9CC2|nr:SidA/IucD/PvdA family monooxygenase [Sinorhizobium meliloti]
MGERTAGRQVDALVIGAGQCGLAAANELATTGLTYLVVDSNAVGESWRGRYDALTLFTPRNLSFLPGRELPGDPLGYASKDEFADYLAAYALNGGFPIETGVEIVSLQKFGGAFLATSAGGAEFAARAVVVATGAFRQPRIPAISQELPSAVLQLHVGSYRNAEQIPPGPVLVVGDGASGRDVAAELSQYHETYLVRGRSRRLLPEKILGRSIWWWLQKLGLLQASPGSRVGRAMRRADPFPNRGRDDAALSGMGVHLAGRLVSSSGTEVALADGVAVAPSSVVWASGYREDFGWIGIPGAVDAENQAMHTQGVSPVPGLYFLGRPWQRNRASALIAGAGADAAFVIGKLQAFLRASGCERDSDAQWAASPRSRMAEPTVGSG